MGGKRSATDGANQRDSKRRSHWQKPGQAGTLSGGVHGILVTCHTHRMREAAGEALALIRSRITNSVDTGVDTCGASTNEDDLEAELAALRAERSTLCQMQTGIKGCILIVLEKTKVKDTDSAKLAEQSLCAEKLLASLFAELAQGRIPPPRDMIRMTPLTTTVTAKLSAAQAALPALLKPYFGEGKPAISWQICFKKRSCDPSVRAREWVPELAKLVHARHPVDLKSPNISVIVEVFRATCGLCVSPSYSKYHGFNCQHKDYTAGRELAPDAGVPVGLGSTVRTKQNPSNDKL